ncbi:MAG: hypothetical protein DSM106950_13515 [Stigonema ocellatum SAG 48.90 = DSM 106950]|nr:hypothetical protein [Stigonema ocellatum SAG 48.90 = DSM 106950]
MPVNILKLRRSIPRLNPLDEFDRLLSTCCPDGSRFQQQNYITFFAGKDLLYGMREQLSNFGFESGLVFRQQILKGIEDSAEDVWTLVTGVAATERIDRFLSRNDLTSCRD